MHFLLLSQVGTRGRSRRSPERRAVRAPPGPRVTGRAPCHRGPEGTRTAPGPSRCIHRNHRGPGARMEGERQGGQEGGREAGRDGWLPRSRTERQGRVPPGSCTGPRFPAPPGDGCSQLPADALGRSRRRSPAGIPRAAAGPGEPPTPGTGREDASAPAAPLRHLRPGRARAGTPRSAPVPPGRGVRGPAPGSGSA